MIDWNGEPKIAGDIRLQSDAQESSKVSRVGRSKVAGMGSVSSNNRPLT